MAGRRYSLAGQLSSATATTRAALISSASVRPFVYDLILSQQSAAPTDDVFEYTIKRITAIGSLAVTSTTPNPLDVLDPATLVTVSAAATGLNATGEPTYGALLFQFSHNRHSVFRWVAAPDGEVKVDNVATHGLGLFAVAASTTFNDDLTLHYVE